MDFLWGSNDKKKKNHQQGRRSSFDNVARRQEARSTGDDVANTFEGAGQYADEGIDNGVVEGCVLARIGIPNQSPLKCYDTEGGLIRTRHQRNQKGRQHKGKSNRMVPPTTKPLSQAISNSLKKAQQLQQSDRPSSRASICQQSKKRATKTKAKATNDIMANLGHPAKKLGGRKQLAQQQQVQPHRKRQNQCLSKHAVGGGANDAVDLTSNDNDDDTGIVRSGRQKTPPPKNPYNINRPSSGRPRKHQVQKPEENMQRSRGSSLPMNQSPPKKKMCIDTTTRSPAPRQKHQISIDDDESISDQSHCPSGMRGTANDAKPSNLSSYQEIRTHPGQDKELAPHRGEPLQVCGLSNSDCMSNKNKRSKHNKNGRAVQSSTHASHFAKNRQVVVQDDKTGTLNEIIEDMEAGFWRPTGSRYPIKGARTKHTEGEQPTKELREQKQQSKSQSPGEIDQVTCHEDQQPKRQRKKWKEQEKQSISQPTSEDGPVDHNEKPPKKKPRSSGRYSLFSDESEEVSHGNSRNACSTTDSDPLAYDPIEEDEDSNNESKNTASAAGIAMRIPRKNLPKKETVSDKLKLTRCTRSSTSSNTSQMTENAPQRRGNAARNGNSLGLTKQNGGKTSKRKKGNAIIPGTSLGPKQKTKKTYGTTQTQSAKKARAKAEAKQNAAGGSLVTAIDLIESDEEEQDEEEREEDEAGGNGLNDADAVSGGGDEAFYTPRQGTTKSFQEEVPRFALGTMIYSAETKVTKVVLENGVLQLISESKSAIAKDNICKAAIPLKDGASDLMSLKYYQKPEQQPGCLSFLAMKVKRTENNLLKTSRSRYDPDSKDDAKAYVVIEFHEGSQLVNLLQTMRELEVAQINDESCLPEDFASESYRKALADADEKEAEEAAKPAKRTSRRKRKLKLGPKVTDAFVAKRSEDTVLLVYPFAGDPIEVENAAVGFVEAGGVEAIPSETHHDDEMAASSDDLICDGINSLTITQSSPSDEIQKPTAAIGETAKTEQRRHFLTIQVRDFERLCPGEFLNDSLIDFWMQWITRKLDPKDKNAGFHCFSSHFYTTLVEEGVSAVTKWTAKRGINIFEKKFIFIPINLTLHWSLCVVVNPGDIFNEEDEDPMACLLFLDSLKAHKKNKISKTLRKWLNSEWERIQKDESSEPFTSNSDFPLLTPRVPYQNNSWDCGVFVCRYAYALFCLRYESFNRGEDWFKNDLVTHCKRDGLFDFDMDDIERLRDNVRELIEKLSRIYVPWKEEQERNLKLERKAKRQRVNQKKEAPSGMLNTSPGDDGDIDGAKQKEEQGDESAVGSELVQESSCGGVHATTAVEQHSKATSSEEKGGAVQEDSSSVGVQDSGGQDSGQASAPQQHFEVASCEGGQDPGPNGCDDEADQDAAEQDSASGNQSCNLHVANLSPSVPAVVGIDESSRGKENQQRSAVGSGRGGPNGLKALSHPGHTKVDRI